MAGRITPTHDMTLTREKADELREFRLVRGDIVLSRRGVMGRCAVVSTEQDGSGSVAVVQCFFTRQTASCPSYLQTAIKPDIRSSTWKRILLVRHHANLNQGRTARLAHTCSYFRVQYEIVRRVEALLTYAERVEARYQTARAQVERLTPSLLAKHSAVSWCRKIPMTSRHRSCSSAFARHKKRSPQNQREFRLPGNQK